MASNVLVADPIANEGIELLKNSVNVEVRTKLTTEELVSIISKYHGLVVRSETKVTPEVITAGVKLQVIGRAGVGVDNIDLDAATLHGTAVVNAPTGNTIAATEHAIAMLLSLARHIPQADYSLKNGEWRRSDFMGTEVRNKTLGIIGLGRVGSGVARRAASFDMKLIGYDPFITPEHASHLGVSLMSFDKILEESDFLTLHTPMTENTNHLLGEREFSHVKHGIHIINVARGGLVDESALLTALENGRVAGAALDVFSKEPPGDSPLLKHPNVVLTPHLGASTVEAQAEVACEVAEQVLDILAGQPARYTVNIPFTPPEVQAVVSPYLETANTLGKIMVQLSHGQFESITILYQGEIANHDTSMLKAAALTGFLKPITEDRLNLVNANVIANQRGLRIIEEKDTSPGEYTSLITLTLNTSEGAMSISGTLLHNDTHIVQVNSNWLDVVPQGSYLLFIEHQDRPGMIGSLGTITGTHDINIGFMAVGRKTPRGHAVMVVGLDDSMPETALEEIRSHPHITTAKLVKL